MRMLGKSGKMAKFVVQADGKNFEACLFRKYEEFISALESKYGSEVIEELKEGKCQTPVLMNIIYYPDINEYQGRRTLQFIINDFN